MSDDGGRRFRHGPVVVAGCSTAKAWVVDDGRACVFAVYVCKVRIRQPGPSPIKGETKSTCCVGETRRILI